MKKVTLLPSSSGIQPSTHDCTVDINTVFYYWLVGHTRVKVLAAEALRKTLIHSSIYLLLSFILPLVERSEEDEKKRREEEEMKRRKEEDLKRRREEEIKRRREVVARVWKQPKVTAAAEVGEGHRGRASQSRKFLNLFGSSTSQYSAPGGCFLHQLPLAVV